MMVSKYVQIEFADPRIRAIDAAQDIRKAIRSASLNLYSRYDVQLQYPVWTDDKVVIEVRIPEEIVDTFKVGYRLRGISAYLLKYCKGRYDQYLVGKRLLTYTVLPENADEQEPKGLSMFDRLEAVAKFARLLERNDYEAMDYTARIVMILNEADTQE